MQKGAARFVTGNYTFETGSMTGILEQLMWESLKRRRKDRRLIMLYKGLKGAAIIPTDDLFPKTGAPVAQCVKRWPTDLADRVRSSLEVKYSQP